MIRGARIFGKVRSEWQECFMHGRKASCHFDLKHSDGTKAHASASFRKLKLPVHADTILIRKETARSS